LKDIDMQRKYYRWQPNLCWLMLIIALMLSACSGGNLADTSGKLRVLATNSIVGDIVNQVGGKNISLSIMMPIGTDPHDFQLRPQDATALTNAQVIFSNGAGLETFLLPMLKSIGAKGKLVEVSAGITLMLLPGSTQANWDPHTWMDPNNVIVWTKNIAAALSLADPVHTTNYQTNAKNYTASLRLLDTWIRTEVFFIPLQNRLLVTDHAVLGYFAAQYGFTQEGTITGSFSSDVAPSAMELAALEDMIRRAGVKAIFVSEAANQTFANQIAADTGIKSVWIYHATLTAAGGPAASYQEFMRYNVKVIVEALK
jgi:ABC-type Zn uptake system ZnuABC Zn-binding protein ZnuA